MKSQFLYIKIVLVRYVCSKLFSTYLFHSIYIFLTLDGVVSNKLSLSVYTLKLIKYMTKFLSNQMDESYKALS